MRIRINKKLSVTIIISLSLIVSIILSLCTTQGLPLLEDEFIITFIGIILGLEITIITFIYSSLDSIFSFITKLYAGNGKFEKQTKVENLLLSGFNELIDNVKFVFIFYILLLIIVIFIKIDIPYVRWPLLTIPKELVCNSVKLFILFTTLIATIDSFFALTNIIKLATFRNKKE